MRSPLLRSTPFRVTLLLGATVFAAMLIAGLVALQLIQDELARRMDSSITDTFNVITQAYGESDETDLFDSVNSHSNATLGLDQVFAAARPDGSILAGNIKVMPDGAGWKTLEASQLGLAGSSARYRLYVGNVKGLRLLVGQSFGEVTAISRLALNSIAWAGAIILVLVTAVGIVIAFSARRRIDEIAETMASVGRGELLARIRVGQGSDDIDGLARQVNTALDRLSALVEGMRQVSVDIAHDLKTPLNRLTITVEEAARTAARGESTAALLAQGELEIHQITATFDALLRIAQIEAGARRARFVPVDIALLLQRLGEAYVDVAEERGQHLAVHTGEGLSEVEGDADLLMQLCANLIENAMRHAPEGTHILVAAEQQGESVVLTCSDDGHGIPEAERAKVFQRLYRIEKSRTTPGSGLGLSLVKAIVELHGATVALEDNGPGLRVSVEFPATGAPGSLSR